MSIPRYYTIGAVAPDARSVKGLVDRLDASDSVPRPVIVLTRRRDERLVRTFLPEEACVQSVKRCLSRRQWLEFVSTFFSASTVSFLMGVVHLWTGLVVQVFLTVAAIVGLVAYRRRPRVRKQLLRLGLPEKLAGEWESSLPSGFALLLATVAEEDFEEAQGAFLEDGSLLSLLAVDRRPVI